MTHKIFRSTFITCIIVLDACFLLTFSVLYSFFEHQTENELKGEIDYIAYSIKDDYKSFFKTFSDKDKRITLISQDGTVIADTNANADEMENHADRIEFIDAQKNGYGSSTRYSKTLTEKTFYYAKKLDNGNVLRISATQYSIVTIFLGLVQPLIFVIVFALILSFILSTRVSKRVIKPINSINLDNPEESDTYEELSPLLHKIVKQNRTISAQIENARHLQEEFRLITENMSEGFLIVDKSFRLLSFNSAALKLLNAKDSNTLSREFITPDTETELSDDAENVFSLNRTSDFRRTISDALGGQHIENKMKYDDRIYTLIANPVKSGGDIMGTVVVIIDVTETEHREQMRREFTANVSHELKTPLTSISGFAELMKDGGLTDETVKDFSSSIYTEAQRLINLVADIIKISELDETSEHLNDESIDIFELSKEIINRLKPSADKKNIKFDITGKNTRITGDRRIIDEMIYNLCDNAIKYNKFGGRVDLKISDDGEKINLSISDTGIGIPPQSQDRVFERFYRVDKSRSKAEGGTGLGLSIVKHAAMYHNAVVSLQSEVDKGTTVTVSFKK